MSGVGEAEECDIRLVEQSHLPARRILLKLGVSVATFIDGMIALFCLALTGLRIAGLGLPVCGTASPMMFVRKSWG